MECFYEIASPLSNEVIQIEFLDFEIEESVGCLQNFLAVLILEKMFCFICCEYFFVNSEIEGNFGEILKIDF